MRLLLATLVAMALFLSLGRVESKPNTGLIDMTQVVHLMSNETECTGFVMAVGLVTTAKHCLGSTDLMLVQFTNGLMREAHVVAKGAGREDDWAVLRCDTGDTIPLRIEREPVDTGASITHVGYPGQSKSQFVRFGFIVSVSTSRLIAIGDAYPGESGGPVFGMDGKVIGITRATLRPFPVEWFVPITRVLDQVHFEGVN